MSLTLEVMKLLVFTGLVAPEFGPFVICALEHTLRVLRSDSKSLSTPHRAAISLYVASVLNHLLQIQVYKLSV